MLLTFAKRTSYYQSKNDSWPSVEYQISLSSGRHISDLRTTVANLPRRRINDIDPCPSVTALILPAPLHRVNPYKHASATCLIRSISLSRDEAFKIFQSQNFEAIRVLGYAEMVALQAVVLSVSSHYQCPFNSRIVHVCPGCTHVTCQGTDSPLVGYGVLDVFDTDLDARFGWNLSGIPSSRKIVIHSSLQANLKRKQDQFAEFSCYTSLTALVAFHISLSH